MSWPSSLSVNLVPQQAAREIPNADIAVRLVDSLGTGIGFNNILQLFYNGLGPSW